MARIRKINVSQVEGNNNAVLPEGTIVAYEVTGEYVLRVHDGVTAGGVPFPNAPSIVHDNDINITVNSGDSSSYTWNFGQTGTLTAPGDIVVGGVDGGHFIIDGTDGDNTSVRWYNMPTNQDHIIIRTYTGNPDDDTALNRGRIQLAWQDSDRSGLRITSYDRSDDNNEVLHNWTFQGDGSLELPGDIRSENAINIDINLTDSTLRRWSFGEDGNLTLPAGGDILDSTGTSVLGGTDTGVVRFDSNVIYTAAGQNLVINPSDDNLNKIVIPGAGNGVNFPLSLTNTEGSVTLTADGNLWTFGADGTTAFPDDAILISEDDSLSISTSRSVTTNNSYTNTTDFSTDVEINGDLLAGWYQRNSEQIEFALFGPSAFQTYLTGLALGRTVIVTYSTGSGNQTITRPLTQRFAETGQNDPNNPTWYRVSGRIDATLPAGQTGIVSINFPVYSSVPYTWEFGEDGSLTLPRGYFKNDTSDGFLTIEGPLFADMVSAGEGYNTISNGVQILTHAVGDDTERKFNFSWDGSLYMPTASNNSQVGAIEWRLDDGIVAQVKSSSGGGNPPIPKGLQFLTYGGDTATTISSGFTNKWIFRSDGTLTIPGNIRSEGNVDIEINLTDSTLRRWSFGEDGNLNIPGDIVDSTGVNQTAQRVEGSWTVTTGTNTYSFTVPMDGTYVMWVKGNIPNGIITWNATLSVTNSNVPAIGTQYAWNYTGGGSPILLTAIPDQIRGTAGGISTDATYAGTTSNRFDFGIANTSGSAQTVYYGYTKI
jgi:hypothetical protein